MQLNEVFNRRKKAITQATFMGAPRAGRDQIDITFTRLRQVVVQTTFVEPGLTVFGFFGSQRDRHAWHEDGLAAQQMGQIVHRQN